MEIIRNKINIENVLCFFIILCPILDITSFLWRNFFETTSSISTIIRPIIPISIMFILFIKGNRIFKIKIFIAGIIYLIYGIIHLVLFNKIRTGISYSNVTHEAQYLINYTFMILNLFIYIYVFKNNNAEKLKKSIIIASYIYITSIFISILTNTSSYTYSEEKMGYKGWFESGNSIGTIFILSMFIYSSYIKDRKYFKIVIPLMILVGIYLSVFLGTRVGLLGFILFLISYIIIYIFYNILHHSKVNKKVILLTVFSICSILLLIITIGSTTLQRRKHLNSIEKNIIDDNINSEAHITGSLLEIRDMIDNKTIQEGYLSKAEERSIIELYNIANELKVKNHDQRMQQLIYNIVLVKNQRDINLILFGNGYLNNYRELVLEMEIPAFLLNFGIIGFLIYFSPFLIIFIYALYVGMKKVKEIDEEYMLLFTGAGFTILISFFAGYTFFNSSTMIIIVIINTLLINKITKLKKD